MADAIARIGGSWTFIIGFLVFLFAWTALNTALIAVGAFDPYPFIFLNLILSMLAALQAPVIMMSQIVRPSATVATQRTITRSI